MNEDRTTTDPDPRERLLDAAEALFADRGFDGTSVRDICERAEMNVASINYHFGDKQRLYVETLKRAHACADSDDGQGYPQWPAGTPPVEKLRGFITVMAARMHTPARVSALQLLMREFSNPSAAGKEIILNYVRPKAQALLGILTELLPGADERRLLMIGFSVIGQILFYRQNRPVVEVIFDRVAELDGVAVGDHVARFTLGALGFGEPYPSQSPPAGGTP
jgi:AcrR family transcriptional regulator